MKITVRQNGVLVDRDVRVLVARAKVTNRAGQRVRLPLDDATARVTGAMLPRSAWRLDDDGQVIATFAASRLLVIAAAPRDEESTTRLTRTRSHREARRRGGSHGRPSSCARCRSRGCGACGPKPSIGPPTSRLERSSHARHARL